MSASIRNSTLFAALLSPAVLPQRRASSEARADFQGGPPAGEQAGHDPSGSPAASADG
ncbi:hypothetical protein [Nocardia niwae]|uniref:Uncharacterized protein n=1 Tax=Nocardia niwae TaxID=626084 RepID=A0ABV2XL98_9NOCA